MHVRRVSWIQILFQFISWEKWIGNQLQVSLNWLIKMWNQKNYVYVDSKEIIIKYLRNICKHICKLTRDICETTVGGVSRWWNNGHLYSYVNKTEYLCFAAEMLWQWETYWLDTICFETLWPIPSFLLSSSNVDLYTTQCIW